MVGGNGYKIVRNLFNNFTSLIYEVRNDMIHLKLLIENNLKTQKYPTPKNALISKRFNAVDKSRKKPELE